MAIVADAAASHGGTAQVQEAPAGGAVVIISLPGHPPQQLSTPRADH
jgi:signal transduction histidine kinase